MALFFWSISVRWFWSVWQSDIPVIDFLAVISGDFIAGLVIIAMIFAKRWWLVAAGFAVLSIAPVVWLSRTLG